MTPYYTDDHVTLYHGDCLDVLASLPDCSVDSVVTDPPYLIAFMGRGWDHSTGIAGQPDVWRQVLRVLKPGGHLLAFGAPRTYHRMAVAVEDAGFEIRDSLMWLFGSGFPKSHDIGKAIDKVNGEAGRLRKFTAWMRTTGLSAAEINKATGTFMGSHYLTDKSQPAIPTPDLWAILRPMCGDVPPWVDELVDRIEAEREVIGTKKAVPGVAFSSIGPTELDITAPATPEAAEWDGWGTAMKPAHEPIILARKPLSGTVAANVLAWGVGGLNVDGCRIASDDDTRRNAMGGDNGMNGTSTFRIRERRADEQPERTGRWPANVILDATAAAQLDQQSGESSDGVAVKRNGVTSKSDFWGDVGTFPPGTPDVGYGGSGGASRFFYTPKADRHERPRVDGVSHPTVKPVDLMAYLVRLITPRGGLVLDPFAGTGTTAEAATAEGCRAILIEREDAYLPLIMQRLQRPVEVTLL